MATGTYYSAQITNINAAIPKANKKNEFGKVYRAYFSGTVVGTDLDIGSKIHLVKVPAGARIVGGKWINGANLMVAAGTIDIGDDASATRFASALAIGIAATAQAFPEDAAAAATGDGHEYTAETIIKATTGGAVLVTGGTYKGWVDFIF